VGHGVPDGWDAAHPGAAAPGGKPPIEVVLRGGRFIGRALQREVPGDPALAEVCVATPGNSQGAALRDYIVFHDDVRRGAADLCGHLSRGIARGDNQANDELRQCHRMAQVHLEEPCSRGGDVANRVHRKTRAG